MRVAHLDVGNRSYYIHPEDVAAVMGGAAAARDRGEWLEFRDVGGRSFHILVATETVVVVGEYEVEDPGPTSEGSDWGSFDWDQDVANQG